MNMIFLSCIQHRSYTFLVITFFRFFANSANCVICTQSVVIYPAKTILPKRTLAKKNQIHVSCIHSLCYVYPAFSFLPVTPTKAPKTPFMHAKTSILPPDEIKVYTIATKPPLKVDAIVVQADLAASLHLFPVTPKVLEK